MNSTSLKFPLAMAAGMALAFWVGHWRGQASVPAPPPVPASAIPVVASHAPITPVTPSREPPPNPPDAGRFVVQSVLAQTDSAASPARNFTREDMAALTGNPALQGILATQQAAVLDLTYALLFDRFRLSPEERDYFKNLLLERQMQTANLGMQLVNVSLAAEERLALGRQIEEGLAGSNARIRTFLNDDSDFAAYQAYTRQEPERFEVGMFAQSLGGLDAATAEALAELLGDARRRYPFTVDFYDNSNFADPTVVNAVAMDRFLDEQVRYQAAVAEQAGRLLTSAQLAVFQQTQAAVRQLMKMQLHGVLQMGGTAP